MMIFLLLFAHGGQVLNGIAWDAVGRRLWLTGKRWPVIYQIELQSI
jgi:glutamine cyclotransferase